MSRPNPQRKNPVIPILFVVALLALLAVVALVGGSGSLQDPKIKAIVLIPCLAAFLGIGLAMRTRSALQHTLEEIKTSRDFYLNLFDNFPNPIWRSGKEGGCDYFNKAWLAFTGRTMAQELGDGWAQSVHPDDLESCLDIYTRSFHARQPFAMEYRLCHHGGQYRWVLDVASPFFGPQGEFTGFIGSCFDLTERKMIENELRLYQKAVENSEDLIGLLDDHHIYRAVNRAFLEYFGIRREQVIGRPMREVVGAECYDSIHLDALRQSFNGTTVKRETLRAYPARGVRYMSFSYCPVRETDGTVGAIVLVAQDNTAQKHLEREREVTVEMLRRLNSHEDSRQLLQSALELLVSYADCEGGGIHINDGSNRPIYESLGLSGDFAASDQAAEGSDLDGELRRLRQHCEREGYESIALIPLKVESNIFGMIHLCDRRLDHFTPESLAFMERLADNMAIGIMRKMVTESHARLATAAEQAGEGIIITSPEGAIQYVNPAFERMTGYTFQDVKGRGAEILHAAQGQEDGLYDRLWSTLREGQGWNGRTTSKKKDGTIFEEETTWSPVRDASGGIANYVSLRRDISNERNLEEQLRQSQKMEAIGRMAGGVAHDFNNLLTAINGYAEILNLKLDSSHSGHNELQEILKAVDRASTLTRQLLAFSRKQELKPCLLDLNDIVTDMEKMLRRLIGEDIDLVSHRAPHLALIRADRGQIEQVLANLVVNARDAMSRGGKLTIETANVEIGSEYLQQHVAIEPGHYVLLTVSDTGCGMDAETRSRIFEPFFTTKDAGRGTGLGLSTVYGIVKQSGGFIGVYSEVGHGTTFKIYLPRVGADGEKVAPEATNLPGIRPDATKTQRRETVLLVEDDETVRHLIAAYLKSAGCLVLEAPLPATALELAQHHPGPIHLMVTDVIMPQMNGRELVAQIKPRRPEMQVLFISGYTENAILDQGNMEPGSAFLQKPFTVGTLSSMVKKLMNEAHVKA